MVGGGPSGLSAALAARRAGAEVILMERWVLYLSRYEKLSCDDSPQRFGCFGGVITTVGMETLAWYRYEGCVNDTEVLFFFNFGI